MSLFFFFQITFNVCGEEVAIPLGDQGDTEAKDSGLVSDEAYHELRMSLPEDQRSALPPISVLKQERNSQMKHIMS